MLWKNLMVVMTDVENLGNKTCRSVIQCCVVVMYRDSEVLTICGAENLSRVAKIFI